MSEVSSSRQSSPDGSASPAPVLLPPSRPYRFTWDPQSRKPGPESEAGTTEGRGGDDFSGPHPLAFLNNSTTSLALGSLPPEWSSSRTGFHAISTVLNNPHKRQAPPKPHSTLPSVPPAELPRVRRKDFDSYLRAVAPEWKRYERSIQLIQDGLAQLDSDDENPERHGSSEEIQLQLPQSLQNKNMLPLNSVPSVFFQNDFNLGDPRTFADVTQQDRATGQVSQQEDAFADPLSLSYSLPLLEKYSQYADTIEQHLVREIFIRSPSFFAALTNLRDLQSESERCLNRISKLRKELADVDNNSAKRGLEMVRKESKMANLGKVWEGVKTIGEVLEMSGVARSLVNAGQWSEALGVIEDVERLWDPKVVETVSTSRAFVNKTIVQNGNVDGRVHTPLPTTQEEGSGESESPETQFTKAPTSSIPLSSFHAFGSLPDQLRHLTMEIAGSLSNELVSVLRNDLELRISSSESPSDADRNLKQSLKPLLLNLIRTRGLKEGILSWREVVLFEIRGVVTKIIPANEKDSSLEASDEIKSGRIKQLKHADFVVLIQNVYRKLLDALERLQTQTVFIIDLLNSLGSELNQNLTNVAAVQEDLSDIVSSAAELSNTQAAKVISCRAEQHIVLELADFLTFFSDSWSFVIKCETICRRMIVGLRGTIVGQAKLFLQAFHQTRISRSAKVVEDELWNPTDISPRLQHIVNVIVDSAVRDPAELLIQTEDPVLKSRTLSGVPNGDSVTPAFDTAMQTTSNGRTAVKHLRIEDRSYYAVAATAEVLTLLLDYLRLVVNLSMLTTDTMSRVIEFLKAFNSRTCQVVLGAGAMRSAGLRNITARHLALASQSLSIIFELIPYIRETFRRHLSQKQAVMLIEFDKLKRDYQEHQNEIHAKLVAIMGDRLNAHIKSLRAVDWATVKSGGVNEYMEILVKETATLHKVLSRYLAPIVVEYVMTQVFAAINHRLSEEYATIELPSEEAKERLLGDAKYLHEKLSVLKNVGAPTEMLVNFVTEKITRKSDTKPLEGESSNSISGSNLTRSNTLTTNQRLRGLISASRPSFLMSADKALPRPSQTPPPPPPASDKPRSPVLPQQQQQQQVNIYGANTLADQLGSVSQISLPDASSNVGEESREGSENPI